MTKPSYTLRVEGDLIVIASWGGQTVESIQAMRRDTEAAVAQGAKDILMVTGDDQAPNEEALQTAAQAVVEVPFRRLAVVGAIPSSLGAASSVIKAVGNNERFKVFRQEADARAWLQGKQTKPSADQPWSKK